ncbi:hypothetical protein [Coraliomargarita parva]|uniref:hypothetical protein n=1 Tax=Coraliomargarita parva TaxID=3014050 RepID=UPI0022B46384|nr:hypothetical protein [Coraliomargarita parva]
MKPLPTYIEKGNFTFTQIKRKGDVAIYARCRRRPVKSGPLSYEVIKITRALQKHVLGKRVLREKGDEIYPWSEKWGSGALTCTSLEAAERRFRQILEESGA